MDFFLLLPPISLLWVFLFLVLLSCLHWKNEKNHKKSTPLTIMELVTWDEILYQKYPLFPYKSSFKKKSLEIDEANPQEFCLKKNRAYSWLGNIYRGGAILAKYLYRNPRPIYRPISFIGFNLQDDIFHRGVKPRRSKMCIVFHKVFFYENCFITHFPPDT